MIENHMNALVYEGPSLLNMRKVPLPQFMEDEVLIRVERVGICGSELSGYLGHNSLRFPPLIMGHEFAGIVTARGDQVQRLNIGDRVTVNPLISCKQCRHCKSGRPQLCADRTIVGAHRPGAFAEYVTVPQENVLVLPDHVSMDRGALTEPLACAVHIGRLAKMKPADRLLILGAGSISLLVHEIAKIHGLSHVVVMDLNKNRLKIVDETGGIAVSSTEELRQSMPEGGFDITVDAVGVNATRKQCVQLTRAGGRIIFSGLHEAESPIEINTAIRNEQTMQGAFCYNSEDFETALEWLGSNKVNLDPWFMHAPLVDGQACFEKLLSDPGSVAKILLTVENK